MEEAMVPGDLAGLLASAAQAGPAHRIEWRDQIAAHGRLAIEAVDPWLAEPNLAAFAIRVIVVAGSNGERDAALTVLRRARRRVDPRVKADVDWALLYLRPAGAKKAAAIPVEVRPLRPVRAERPHGVGGMTGASRRSARDPRPRPS